MLSTPQNTTPQSRGQRLAARTHASVTAGIAVVGLLLGAAWGASCWIQPDWTQFDWIGAASAAPDADAADIAGVRRLLKDPSPSARAAAVRRLAGSSSGAARAVVIGAMDDPHPYVRRASAGVLSQILDPAERKQLATKLLRHRSERVRAEACRTYLLWADDIGRGALIRALDDRVAAVRQAAVRDLGEWNLLPETSIPETSIVAPLTPRLRDTDGAVRAATLDALQRIGALTPEQCRAHLDDPDFRVRIAALESSVALAGEAAVVAVIHGLDDAVWSVRLSAAELSVRVRDRRVLEALMARLDDERMRVRAAAHAALVGHTGIPFGPQRERWVLWLQEEGDAFDPHAVPPEATRVEGHTVAGARFMELPLVSRNVAFVVDASGSMSGRRPDGSTHWDAVRAALDSALRSLRVSGGARVNVICFATTVEAAFPKAKPLNSVSLRLLERWLAQRAPAGKTALYDGIAAALLDPDVDSVIVLSDGAPSAGSFFTKTDLLTEVRRLNRFRRARIDVIAIGADRVAARWRDVLQRIARENGGRFLRR